MIFGVGIALAQSVLDTRLDADMQRKLPYADYLKWRNDRDAARRHSELISAIRSIGDCDRIGDSSRRPRLYKTARLFGVI